jgi:hypothetical protein
VVTYFPLFKALTNAANPALAAAPRKSPVTVTADPGECSFQFNPTGTAKFTSSCDIAKQRLASTRRELRERRGPAGTSRRSRSATRTIAAYDGEGGQRRRAQARTPRSRRRWARRSRPRATRRRPIRSQDEQADDHRRILTILVIYVTMVYGPIAAMLVELFPTRIRYTSMSLPYHIGNGWFGGLLPATSFAIVAANGNIYSACGTRSRSRR